MRTDSSTESEKKTYSVELIDFGDKKIQIALFLKNQYGFSDAEAIQLVSAAPCFLLENVSNKKVAPLLKKLSMLPVEYKVYTNGLWTAHKGKKEFEDTKLYEPLNKPKRTSPSVSLYSSRGMDSFFIKDKEPVTIRVVHSYPKRRKRSFMTRLLCLLGWKWIFDKMFGDE